MSGSVHYLDVEGRTTLCLPPDNQERGEVLESPFGKADAAVPQVNADGAGESGRAMVARPE
jgi:hypothetical protein